MITKQQYSFERNEDLQAMRKSEEFALERQKFLTSLIEHRVVYQTTWMGEPVLQLPQDLLTAQEILYSTRPDFIVEVGVAWAGSLLFLAHMQEQFGGVKVIGIDTYIPGELRERIKAKGDISKRIEFIEESSLSEACLARVEEITGGSREVLVHLDSDHTADHVFSELQAYSPLVGPGHYLICGDTHVELVKKGVYKGKPYDRGNNPMVALDRFLETDPGKNFSIDETASEKYALSLNPRGYLFRTKNLTAARSVGAE